LRVGDSAVTTHFDFRSLASFWATATYDEVMLAATKSREKAACAAPSAAAKSNHIYTPALPRRDAPQSSQITEATTWGFGSPASSRGFSL
jgi:hypothetical protein